jgi:hypothetical protein
VVQDLVQGVEQPAHGGGVAVAELAGLDEDRGDTLPVRRGVAVAAVRAGAEDDRLVSDRVTIALFFESRASSQVRR